MKNISFVIPVYNEELRLKKTFKALRELQLPRGLKLKEVIFVNDGSTDKTKTLIRQFTRRHSEATSRRILGNKTKEGKILRDAQNDKSKKPQDMNITLISYSQNRGKGYAIRQGMAESSADYTLFFDADMSTPLKEIAKFMPFIKNNVDVIVGTRKNGHSTVIKHQPLVRELLGRGFTKLTQLSLGVHVTDFTCGFKAFSKEAKSRIISKAVIDGWGYDAELLFLAQKENLSISEKSVEWSNDERTTVKLYKAIPQTILELITIHREHTINSRFATLSPLRFASK